MASDPPEVVYCWGHTDHGQLGLRGQPDDQLVSPTPHDSLGAMVTVTDVATGPKHTLVAGNGVHSFGCNDMGQLGHQRPTNRPEPVEVLDSQTVVQVACGVEHSLALTDTGQLFSWGSNQCGQLGRGDADQTNSPKPKLVRTLSPHFVIQIAAGYNHCIALTLYGELYTWGSNSHGQLGLGTVGVSVYTPQRVSSLDGLCVHQVAAGCRHSCVVTVSGTMFTWGSNNFGQLGLGDNAKSKPFPTLVKTLKSQIVRFICCGEDHTAVITKDGGVFTFGYGRFGQLGHNSLSNEMLPKKVFELMGSVVTQIACGRCHTLAFVPASGRLYSFGLGANGQLGIGQSTSNRSSPSMVKGPFVPASGTPSSMPVDMATQKPVVARRMYSGGDQCFVQVTAPGSGIIPDDYRKPQAQRKPVATLSEERMREYSSVPARGNPSEELLEDLEKVFSSVSSHNGSFLLAGDIGSHCTSRHSGVDLERAVDYYARLARLPNRRVTDVIVRHLERTLLPQLKASPPDIESLRVYLTLPACHAFDAATHYNTVICPYARAVNNLRNMPARILDRWWSKLCPEHFERLINIYKQVVMFILCLPPPTGQVESIARDRNMVTCLDFLKKLNTVNEESPLVVPVERFYISELQDKVDLKKDYVHWITSHTPHAMSQGFAFCNYPFVFDAEAKTILLQTDAIVQMRVAMDEVARHNMTAFITQALPPVSPCLVLVVSRDNIVQDTIVQIQKAIHCDFKKPLKVVFVGEDAVDEGGVRKEFFLLIMREVLDPKYGMFQEFEDSRLLWFQEQTFEDRGMFQLIGVLCGLAIYNSTILDLPFPLALYKKLLKKQVTLDDLVELDPPLGRNLKNLLNDDSEDFEDTWCLTFEITREVFGEVKQIPLLKNGDRVSVTKDNRQQYVDAYIDYVFNASVKEQFQAFHDGFHRVCGGKVLELFHPLELQAMVIGNENYDWDELKKNAEYKGVYHLNHPTIIMFWDVFFSLSQDNKKKFLLYLTGSDRIPIQGMKAIKVFIQSTSGGDNYLPVAHTCFNLLDLPNYSTKQILHTKLLKAIQHAHGFALV